MNQEVLMREVAASLAQRRKLIDQATKLESEVNTMSNQTPTSSPAKSQAPAERPLQAPSPGHRSGGSSPRIPSPRSMAASAGLKSTQRRGRGGGSSGAGRGRKRASDSQQHSKEAQETFDARIKSIIADALLAEEGKGNKNGQMAGGSSTSSPAKTPKLEPKVEISPNSKEVAQITMGSRLHMSAAAGNRNPNQYNPRQANVTATTAANVSKHLLSSFSAAACTAPSSVAPVAAAHPPSQDTQAAAAAQRQQTGHVDSKKSVPVSIPLSTVKGESGLRHLLGKDQQHHQHQQQQQPPQQQGSQQIALRPQHQPSPGKSTLFLIRLANMPIVLLRYKIFYCPFVHTIIIHT